MIQIEQLIDGLKLSWLLCTAAEKKNNVQLLT